MSDFVNFRKRGVSLPAGCKDLIDVLHPASAPAAGATVLSGSVRPLAWEGPTVTHGHRSSGGLHQVAGFLARLFESRSELSTLMISSAAEDLTAMFYLRGAERVFVLILIANNPKLERAVRSFYRERGILPVRSYPIPKQEGGGLGWGLVFPMPSLPIETVRLTSDLLRTTSSAGEEAELRFRYYQPVPGSGRKLT
jgi:hypothetical protein